MQFWKAITCNHWLVTRRWRLRQLNLCNFLSIMESTAPCCRSLTRIGNVAYKFFRPLRERETCSSFFFVLFIFLITLNWLRILVLIFICVQFFFLTGNSFCSYSNFIETSILVPTQVLLFIALVFMVDSWFLIFYKWSWILFPWISISLGSLEYFIP